MRVRFPFLVASTVLAGVCLATVYVRSQSPESENVATPAPVPLPAPVAASAAPSPGREAAKDGSVWGALVYATTAKPGEAKPEDPEDFPHLGKRLAKAFPFDRFEVIGQHTQVVFREYESWVVPSRDLFLKLDSKGTTQDGALNLHIQFWRGQTVAIKTDTVLRQGSPLFIGGPKWRDGRLIFVLELKADAKAKE